MCQVLDHKLSLKIFGTLRERCDLQVFKRDFVVIYSGQVPNVGVFLVSGKIQLEDQRGARNLENPCVIGLRELMSRTPSNASVSIQKGSQVLLLERQVLREYFSGDRNLAIEILGEIDIEELFYG